MSIEEKEKVQGPDWEAFGGKEGGTQVVPDETKEEIVKVEEKPVAIEVSPVWNWIKAKDESFEIPKEVLEGKLPEGKTEDDIIEEVLSGRYTQTVDVDDPFVKEYLEVKTQEGFDMEKWMDSKMSSKKVTSLTDKDFAKYYLKTFDLKTDSNPDGYTAEEIESMVDKMEDSGMLKLNVKAFKNEYNEKVQAYERQRYEEYHAKQNEAIAKDQAVYKEDLIKLKDKVKGYEDVFGIKVSKAEMEKYADQLEQVFTYDDKGQRPFDRIISDDELLARMLFFALKGDSVKAHITDLKESAKEDVERRLELGQEQRPGSASDFSGGPDWVKFAQEDN